MSFSPESRTTNFKSVIFVSKSQKIHPDGRLCYPLQRDLLTDERRPSLHKFFAATQSSYQIYTLVVARSGGLCPCVLTIELPYYYNRHIIMAIIAIHLSSAAIKLQNINRLPTNNLMQNDNPRTHVIGSYMRYK